VIEATLNIHWQPSEQCGRHAFFRSREVSFGSTQRAIKWVWGTSFMRLKRQGLEVSAEVKNEWRYTCTHPYAFIVCKREKF